MEVDVSSTGMQSGLPGNSSYTDEGVRYTNPFTCVVS